ALAYSVTPRSNDFVQLYVQRGHGVAFSTPDFGLPDALNGSSNAVTIPAEALEPDVIYSLTIQVTRLAFTNETCYTNAAGTSGTFSSTSMDLVTIFLPEITLLSAPTNAMISLEVRTDPGKTVVLESTGDLTNWTALATNAAPSGTNAFTV